MAHELYENDMMFSVREVPWHGLGNIIEDYPTIEEAKTASGLWWTASLERMKVPMTIEGLKVDIEVPNQFAIVRNDIHSVIGVVGNRYEIYQNQDMWDFIEEFQKQSGVLLETAGSLRNGQTTWVLAKNRGATEVIKNDPIEQYFLFRNSFDGSTPISVLFTNIRVVCNNTLTAALGSAKCMFNIRHTKNAEAQIREATYALHLATEYHSDVKKILKRFSKYRMGFTKMEEFIENEIFPIPTQVVQTVGEGDEIETPKELTKQAETLRNKKIETVLGLIETGAGTDIKGVKGTAYGLYQALTEYADHEKVMRVHGDRDENEIRFENAFFGTNANFKANCFKKVHELVKG